MDSLQHHQNNEKRKITSKQEQIGGDLFSVFDSWIKRDSESYRTNLMEVLKSAIQVPSNWLGSSLWNYHDCEIETFDPETGKNYAPYMGPECFHNPDSPECLHWFVASGRCKINNVLWASVDNPGSFETCEKLPAVRIRNTCEDICQDVNRDHPNVTIDLHLFGCETPHTLWCWCQNTSFITGPTQPLKKRTQNFQTRGENNETF